MSLEEARAEALRVPEVAEPLLRGEAALRLSARGVQALVTLGRFACVWLPAYALSAPVASSFLGGVAGASIVAVVWYVAVRTAFAATRLTLAVRGIALAAIGGSLLGLVLVSALDFWLPGLHLGPVKLLQIAIAVPVLVTAWEFVTRTSIASRKRVLVVGANDGGSDLVEELALVDDSPFDVVGVVDDDRDADHVAGAPLLGRIADLPRVIGDQRPDLVVLAVAQNRLEAFGLLLTCAGDGFRVVELPQFYEQAFGRVPVRRLTAAWFMSVLHLYQKPYTRFAKRTFDVAVASFGLILTAPLYPLLALLVKRTKGPVIFSQTRLGEGGRHFTIYKFRTMRDGAEEPGQPLWAEERDPRVTALGRFMRRTRLDELPQLWNVLRGDMSVVGPRPERPEFVDLLEQAVPFWTRRHLVKPGITGWAQISAGYTADAEGTVEKLSYDLWYLRHRSLMVDLAICARTLGALVSGSGAR